MDEDRQTLEIVSPCCYVGSCEKAHGFNPSRGVNRHTMQHYGPCRLSCSFGWCLAEGHRIGDWSVLSYGPSGSGRTYSFLLFLWKWHDVTNLCRTWRGAVRQTSFPILGKWSSRVHRCQTGEPNIRKQHSMNSQPQNSWHQMLNNIQTQDSLYIKKPSQDPPVL